MSVGEERLTADTKGVVVMQVVVGEEGFGGEGWIGEVVVPWEVIIRDRNF